MDVSYDVTSALRAEMHHHEPIVLIRGGDAPVGSFQEKVEKHGLLDTGLRCCQP